MKLLSHPYINDLRWSADVEVKKNDQPFESALLISLHASQINHRLQPLNMRSDDVLIIKSFGRAHVMYNSREDRLCSIIIIMLIISTHMVRGAAKGGRWSFIKCHIDCMPMCMTLKNAKLSECRIACKGGCEQLQGRGVVQANGWPLPQINSVPFHKL